MHAYVTVPGGKTSYLSELGSGKEVIIVDQNGLWRTAIVGRVKIESRPLILVEAKVHRKGVLCCKCYAFIRIHVHLMARLVSCRITLEMTRIAFFYKMQKQLHLSSLTRVSPLCSNSKPLDHKCSLSLQCLHSMPS